MLISQIKNNNNKKSKIKQRYVKNIALNNRQCKMNKNILLI